LANLLQPAGSEVADSRLAEHHRLPDVGAEPAEVLRVADDVGLQLVVAHVAVRDVRRVVQLDVSTLGATPFGKGEPDVRRLETVLVVRRAPLAGVAYRVVQAQLPGRPLESMLRGDREVGTPDVRIEAIELRNLVDTRVVVPVCAVAAGRDLVVREAV